MVEGARRSGFQTHHALIHGALVPMAPWDIIVDPIKDLIDTISSAIDFIQDPALWTLVRLQEACSGMVGVLMKGVQIAAEPDLNAEWFLNIYKLNFTLSLIMLILILGWQFVQLARRQISGDELMESMTYYAPTYFLGTMFGPGTGALLVKLFGALTNGVTDLVLGKASADMTTQLKELITMDNVAAVTGGVFVAIFVMFLMAIGLLLALVIVIIQMVTLYFSGVAVPLGLVWMINPKNRDRAWKLPTIWLGMLSAHVLLVMMLGFAMLLAVNLSLDPGNEALEILVNLVAVTVAMFMAALAPAGLLKFVASAQPGVPVSGPQVGVPHGSGGAASPASTSEVARDQAQSSNADGAGTSDSGNTGSDGGGVGRLEAAGTEEDEGILSAGADSDPTSDADAGEQKEPEGPSVDPSLGDTDGIGTGGVKPGGVDALTKDGATKAGEAGEAAEAAEGAEAAEAAGAASSSTGVGAIVGIPLIVGAEAMKAGAKVADLAQQGAEYAQEPMDEMDYDNV